MQQVVLTVLLRFKIKAVSLCEKSALEEVYEKENTYINFCSNFFVWCVSIINV